MSTWSGVRGRRQRLYLRLQAKFQVRVASTHLQKGGSNRHERRDTPRGPDREEVQMALHNQTLDCLDPLCARVCARVCVCVQQMQLHVVNYSKDCWHERNKFITRDREKERQREREEVIAGKKQK